MADGVAGECGWFRRMSIDSWPASVTYSPGERRWYVYVWTHELAHRDTGARVPLKAFRSKHRFRWQACRSARDWLAFLSTDKGARVVVNAPGGRYGPEAGGTCTTVYQQYS